MVRLLAAMPSRPQTARPDKMANWCFMALEVRLLDLATSRSGSDKRKSNTPRDRMNDCNSGLEEKESEANEPKDPVLARAVKN